MPSNSPAPGRVAGVRKPVVLAVGLAFGLALGSFGIAAAAPSSISTKALAQIKVCVTKSNGKIRYLKQSMDDCNDNEILLRWDTKAGEDGQDGQDGQDGKNGINGKDGLPGAIGATGPSGSSGSAGSAGTAGVDGRTILSGAVAPASGTGANGDFYLNTATSMLYGPKASGAWPAGVSLVGANGNAGVDGVSGREQLSSVPQVLSGMTTSQKLCTSPKLAIGGGFEFTPSVPGADYPTVYTSRPNSGGTGWEVIASDENGSGTMKVWVVCAAT